MKARALALGVDLSKLYEGTWVNISDGSAWKIQTRQPIPPEAGVKVYVQEGNDWTGYELVANMIVKGDEVRVAVISPAERKELMFLNLVEVNA